MPWSNPLSWCRGFLTEEQQAIQNATSNLPSALSDSDSEPDWVTVIPKHTKYVPRDSLPCFYPDNSQENSREDGEIEATDLSGKVFSCAVAHGSGFLKGHDIPGKTDGKLCWFSVYNNVHTETNFSVVIGHEVPDAIDIGEPHGQEPGRGARWCAVARTKHGAIPGKVDVKGYCSYVYNGEVHKTSNYNYVSGKIIGRFNLTTKLNDGTEVSCCVADLGDDHFIPGWTDGTVCHYGKGFKEYQTKRFRMVSGKIVDDSNEKGDPVCHERGGGDRWCAIAYTVHGELPAKANSSGTCWFVYDGVQAICETFKYVSCVMELSIYGEEEQV